MRLQFKGILPKLSMQKTTLSNEKEKWPGHSNHQYVFTLVSTGLHYKVIVILNIVQMV